MLYINIATDKNNMNYLERFYKTMLLIILIFEINTDMVMNFWVPNTDA